MSLREAISPQGVRKNHRHICIWQQICRALYKKVDEKACQEAHSHDENIHDHLAAIVLTFHRISTLACCTSILALNTQRVENTYQVVHQGCPR